MTDISKQHVIGFVGLGVMGKSMARNLLQAGFTVVVYNRSGTAADELVALGGRRADSLAALAAQCDVVGLCLPDTPDVEQVLFGAHGMAPALRRGSVVIDFSTIAAPATVDFAARLRQAGVELLDSPVSGGPKGASEGTLSCMIGGDAEVLARCMPVFRAIGKTFTHIGPSGAGQLCKSCNQLAVFGTVMAVFEALTLARKSGIDPDKVRDALLGGSAQSFVLQNHARRFLDGQYAPGFRVTLMQKDLRLAHAAAQDAASFAPVAALAEQLLAALRNTGRADLDSTALGLLYEDLSGIVR
ncbi:NAD(P)-dependent oxidoreductase [Variovorax terrae]|uniref:NAD(P)-dependent oxidoreductase n=1 Tax=Variovorax terrae TaxID=2923278 RepID=A0A9X1VWX4_9BURK|nr:NAD(P)-dependent oxidoreductase [Variovorax terrae]MCJ0763412.1 NAD(P)-dependent oxidoreductase [Variovorax terrae]